MNKGIAVAFNEEEAEEIRRALREHGGDKHTWASSVLADIVQRRIQDARDVALAVTLAKSGRLH